MKRRKNNNRVKVSFAATILVLTAAVLIAYAFSFNVPSYSIPSDLKPYTGVFGMYSPSNSLLVTFDNFTAIRAVNQTAVPNSQLLKLTKPAITVPMSTVSSRTIVTLLNSTTHVNNTATVAFVSRGTYSNLSLRLSDSGIPSVPLNGFDAYNVTDTSNGITKQEWVTLVPEDSAVVFSEGASPARTTIGEVLQVRQGLSPSILSVQNVTRMLYAAGGATHLALAIENFPVQVLTSKMGVVAVDVVSGHVQVTNIVGFVSSSFASSQLTAVKSSYKFASDFSIYEECIRADETFALTNLQGAVNLAGE